MRCSKQKQGGAALITAIMVLAICASLATYMLVNQRLLIHQSQLALGSDRLSAMLDGVQDWAISVVETTPDITKLKPLNKTLNGITLHGQIIAADGEFNINELANTAKIPNFARLLQSVDHNITKEQAMLIATNASQWVMNSGHTDTYYSTLSPPYRAAQFPMTDISELRLVKGVSLKLYSELLFGQQPYVTALPADINKININYASIPALMTIGNLVGPNLSGGLSLSQATQLVECRKAEGYFKQPSDFINRCAMGMPDISSMIGTTSNYYYVVGSASQGGQQETVRSLLKIFTVNNKHKAMVVWQEYNGE